MVAYKRFFEAAFDWKTKRLFKKWSLIREVVAYEKWSLAESWLHIYFAVQRDAKIRDRVPSNSRDWIFNRIKIARGRKTAKTEILAKSVLILHIRFRSVATGNTEHNCGKMLTFFYNWPLFIKYSISSLEGNVASRQFKWKFVTVIHYSKSKSLFHYSSQKAHAIIPRTKFALFLFHYSSSSPEIGHLGYFLQWLVMCIINLFFRSPWGERGQGPVV